MALSRAMRTMIVLNVKSFMCDDYWILFDFKYFCDLVLCAMICVIINVSVMHQNIEIFWTNLDNTAHGFVI